MVNLLKKLKNFVSPSYWSDKIAERYNLYYKAENNQLRKKIDSLEGWQWWTWQILVGLLVLSVFEALLNSIGLTILPWRMF